MKHPKVRKDLIGCTIITLIYIVLSVFHFHLDKFFPGIPVKIIVNLFFGLLVLLFIVQVVKVIKRKKKMHSKSKLKWIYYAPLLILSLGVLYFFSPLKLSSELLESKVYLRGCYQGNLDQAVIRFRASKNFEIIWTNENGTDEWFFGTYTQKKDTFFLNFDDRVSDKFGSVIINNGLTLVAVSGAGRAEKSYIVFTVGYCRDLQGNTIK